MTDAELLEYAVGFDPARNPAERWDRKRLFMIRGSGGTVVPPRLHMESFLERATPPEFIHYELATHGDHAGFMP